MEQNYYDTLIKIIQEKNEEINTLKDQLSSTEYDFIPNRWEVSEARKRWLILKSQKNYEDINDLADEINEEIELVLDMLWYSHYENAPGWVITKYLNIFDSYLDLLVEMGSDLWDSNYNSYNSVCEALGIFE